MCDLLGPINFGIYKGFTFGNYKAFTWWASLGKLPSPHQN